MTGSSRRLQGVRSTISCTSCKARKRGCDFRKPVCTRCERTDQVCYYKPRSYEFVQMMGGSGGASDASTSRSSSGSPPVVANASLLATDFTLQAIEAFWSVYLPSEADGIDGRIGGLLSAPWISVVKHAATEDTCVRQALMACAFAGLGWTKDDFSLVRGGTRPYLCALSEVNRALQSPQQATTDNVLVACRTLSLFEMLRKLPTPGYEQMEVTSWQAHAAGAYRLLELRGRAVHMHGQGLQLYDAVRLMGVMQGLNQRRGNAFTELGWSMPQNDLRDELFDLMSSVPALFGESDKILAQCSLIDLLHPQQPVMADGSRILDRYLAIGEELASWEAKALLLCNSAPDDLCTLTATGDSSLHDECTAHGYAFFYACEQYWASCLITYSSCIALQVALQRLDSPPLPLLPTYMQPEVYMEHIVSTCSHFFAPDAGLWSAQAAIFPFSVALIYLMRTGRRNSAQYNTIFNAVTDNKAGSVMADFLRNLTPLSTER